MSDLPRCITSHTLLAAPLAGALLATAQPTLAETATLTPIRVTATKTNLTPDEVPESVSVVDRKAIEREQPTNLGDLLQDLPNVAVGGGPRGLGQQFVIRGLSDERILLLVDGVRQNYQRGHDARIFIEPDLLRQVEVLRGPASALWGSGALGGVIAMTTADATDLLAPGQTLGARLKAGYHSVDDQWLTSAAVYGIAGEQVDYLLNLSYRDGGDVRLGDGRDLEHSGLERLSGLAKFSWSPDRINRLTATYIGFDDDSEVPSNPQIAATDDTLVERTTKQHNLSLRYTHDDPNQPYLNPSLLAYRNETDIEERRRVDQRHDETQVETIGFDLRNSMHFAAAGPLRQTLTYGIDYYQDEVEASRDGATRDSYPGGSQEVIGVYVQDEVHLGERWTLIPGLRWDSYKSEADAPDIGENDDSAWSAKIGLRFAVTDWLSLLASYNEAFRAPSVSELFTSGTHFTCGPRCANLFIPNPDLAPEQAHNKEIGVQLHKTDLIAQGDEGRLRAQFFRNDVTDFIDQIVLFTPFPTPGLNPGPGGYTTWRNVNDAELEGFEIEASYQTSRWLVGAAYSQTRGEDKKTGEWLSSVQPDEWRLKAALRFPAQALELGWIGRFVAEQQRVPADGTPSQSYDVHDLWLSWRPASGPLAALGLDLGVENLFDEDYTPYLSALQDPGRNIKATLSWRF